ncbi:MAG: GspE/PulE/PilB domain-containing protein [Planctomycetota bacterium]|jgi:hypothetical protein
MKKFDKIFKKRLEKILIDSGLINDEIADHAQSVHTESGKLIGDILIEGGYVTEDDIARELSRQLQLPFLTLENYSVAKGTVEMLPPEILHRYQILPIDVFGDTMSVAMSQHLTLEAFREIQGKANRDITFFVARISRVRKSLDEFVPMDKATLEKIRKTKKKVEKDVKPASWTDIFDTANKNVAGEGAPKPKKPSTGLGLFDTANTKVMENLQKPDDKGKKGKKPSSGLGLFDTAHKNVMDGLRKTEAKPKPKPKPKPKEEDKEKKKG